MRCAAASARFGAPATALLRGAARRWQATGAPTDAPERGGGQRVEADQLRWRCDPQKFHFSTTKDLPVPAGRPVGQDKAVSTLEMGLRMRSPGYNVMVCGEEGSGRRTAIRWAQKNMRRGHSVPAATGKRLRGKSCAEQDPHSDTVALAGQATPCRLRRGVGDRLRAAVAKVLRTVQAHHAKTAKQQENAPNKKQLAASRGKLNKLIGDGFKALQSAYAHKMATKTDADKENKAIVLRYLRWLKKSLLTAKDFSAAEAEYGVTVLCKGIPEKARPPLVWATSTAPASLLGDGKNGGFKPGALLQAHGGVLVVAAEKLTEDPEAWAVLRLVMASGKVDLSEVVEGLTAMVSIDVKVIVFGDEGQLRMLRQGQSADEDDAASCRLFKVKVSLEEEARRTDPLVFQRFPAVFRSICDAEGLLPVRRCGAAGLIEFAVRLASRRTKISLGFGAIRDLLREASYWAARDHGADRRAITEAHVTQALRSMAERRNSNELAEREKVTSGEILIDTSGRARVGQVNALVVYSSDGHSFGIPARLTAETSVGTGGIIDIERESGYSGDSHSKGVQIISGFLRARFAQKRPLSLTGSICFEQSHCSVDGDSASSAEVFAILSSLAGVGIRQDVGVTGSVNQKGDIQPVGGVNEKIEGFFECVRPTLAARKRPAAVIIPKGNLENLQLNSDLVEAVQNELFEIYLIETVEEGVAILMDQPAGRRLGDTHEFEVNSVFWKIDQRLAGYHQGLRLTQLRPRRRAKQPRPSPPPPPLAVAVAPAAAAAAAAAAQRDPGERHASLFVPFVPRQREATC